MSVKYSWNRQNGAAMPSVRFMSIDPAEDYYKGMPLKLKEKGIVEPTDGDPEYICMAQYDPDAEIQPLEIPVQEVFPDVVYDRMNDDGTIEEVRFGSKGGGGDLLETVETEVPLEITWDGDLTGKEVLVVNEETFLVKMSDAILSVDQVLGSIIKYTDYSGNVQLEATADNVQDLSSSGLPTLAVMAEDGTSVVQFVLAEFTMEGITFSSGIWFLYQNYDPVQFVNSLTCPNATTTTTKQQLRPSLLPNHKHKWDDIEDAICWDRSKSEPLNFEFDGNLDNYEIVETDGMFVVKVSDAVLTMDDLIGGTVLIVDGEEEREVLVTNEKMVDMGASAGVPLIIIHNGDSGGMGSPFVMVMYGTSEQMPLSLGVWFVYQDEIHYTKALSNPNATITTSEIKKIDNKFIDAEWMAVTGEVKADTPILEATVDTNNLGKGIDNTGDIVFTAGQKYIVVFDNVDYICYGEDYSSLVGVSTGTIIGLGDFYIAAGQGTGRYPFCVYSANDNTDVTCCALIEGEHSFAIYEVMEGATPLPPKFMPELTQVILISPGGKKFKTTVDDTGQLVTTEV